MEYLGTISNPNDLTNKQYVDDKVGGVNTSLTSLTNRVKTNEDNIAMAESDINDIQIETGTLKTDMTTVKGAITTLQNTYVPNTTKVNGKALSTDIDLSATDVGALPSTTTYVESVDGVSGAVTTNAVKFVTQSITTQQKTQARTNIGAGNTNFYKVNNVSIPTSAWVANINTQSSTQEKQDYPFMATISVVITPGVTSSDIARVMFGYTEQTSENFSANCYTTTGGVTIQAKEKPNSTITLDYILIERIL